MSNDNQFLQADYWNGLYENNETAWDIGYVSTPIKEYIDQLTDKNISILIPGAGKSHEAVYLADNGFTDITVVDISAVVTQALQERLASSHPSIKIITGNFFELDSSYDLIVEQTFFCALDPSLRQQYVEKVNDLLTGSGKLAGVLFNRNFEINPPFGGSSDEYRQLFSPLLRIKVLEACYNSIPRRQGSELFLIASRD